MGQCDPKQMTWKLTTRPGCLSPATNTPVFRLGPVGPNPPGSHPPHLLHPSPSTGRTCTARTLHTPDRFTIPPSPGATFLGGVWGVEVGGWVGVGWGDRGEGFRTRPWWWALLACGGAYWPLALEPSAMTRRHPHYCGHPHCRGHRGGQLLSAATCNMRREERVTVQGPVKKQQPDGMSHRGGLGGQHFFCGLWMLCIDSDPGPEQLFFLL